MDPTPWTQALHAGGHLSAEHAVVSVDAEQIGIGESMMSDVWRVMLHYDEIAAGPTSVVVKLACTEPARRVIADRFDFYRREADFYGLLAPVVGLRSPRCLAQRADPASGEFTLVLEDLDTARAVPQLAGATYTDAVTVGRDLAHMHAQWWGRTSELPIPVAAIDHPRMTEHSVTTFEHAWPACRALAGDRLPRPIAALGDDWQHVAPALIQRIATPATLCHGDVRVDNIRFAADGVIAFDWQLVVIANGVVDLAYFASQSMRTAERSGRDGHLLDEYLAALARHGVHFGRDEAWQIYRAAVLAMLIFPVSLSGGWDELSPHGQRTVTTMLDRSVAAIMDLEAWRVLPTA
jgi:hypothetical protein